MIKLINVNKTYTGDKPVYALKNISVDFDDTGFTAMMGASGSGKTTLLNIITGLDVADNDDGQIIIDGVNIKNFKEQDFNEYRNKNLGFVFQNQNLISHLTVIENIELSLTIAGLKKEEQRSRAIEALKFAELREEHINKRPNQLSGGEQQRVQIARAIVNNPKIILADEPISALDEPTRLQIMQLFKKLSKKCLVLMVTHNKESIEKYVDRIVTLGEGKVIDDKRIEQKNKKAAKQSDIIEEKTDIKETHKKMPFWAAFKLALKNMRSKFGQTLVMSFASSIGIAALTIVMAVSLGFSHRIAEARNENLQISPLVVATENYEYNFEKDDDYAYLQNAKLTKNVNIITKNFIDNCINNLDKTKYNFSVTNNYLDMHFVTPRKAELSNILNFQQMMDKEILLKHYDIVNTGGRLPEEGEYTEIMLVLDQNNSISSELLNAFGISGLTSQIPIDELVRRINTEALRVVFNNDYYSEFYSSQLDITTFTPKLESVLVNNYLANETALKVTGVLRSKPDNKINLLKPGFVYTYDLYEYVQNIEKDSNITKEQLRLFNVLNKDWCAISGKPDLKNLVDKIALLKKLGYNGENNEFSDVSSIDFYVNSLEDKNYIVQQINNYNATITDSNFKISFVDMANAGAKTIGNIEQTILKVLIIFAIAAIIISSILIMTIMFNSVKERVKEIGILRTMGARRKDIMRIFMSEVAIIGLIAGVIGIVSGVLFNLIINGVFNGLIAGFSVIAEIRALDLLLIGGISIFVALVAGFVPSLIASIKPPIDALRK